MKTYWDHAEKERSELTAEQVESLLALELMEKGVVAPEPPTLLPVEMPEVPKRTIWKMQSGYQSTSVGYETAEQAAAAIDGAYYIGSANVGGHYVSTAQKADFEAKAEQIVDQGEYVRLKSQIDAANAAKNQNDKALEEYNADLKCANEAVEGVWDDYRGCQGKSWRFKKIVDTRDEYARLCEGNQRVAATFLAKAYPADEILDAMQWFGLDVQPATAELQTA